MGKKGQVGLNSLQDIFRRVLLENRALGSSGNNTCHPGAQAGDPGDDHGGRSQADGSGGDGQAGVGGREYPDQQRRDSSNG